MGINLIRAESRVNQGGGLLEPRAHAARQQGNGRRGTDAVQALLHLQKPADVPRHPLVEGIAPDQQLIKCVPSNNLLQNARAPRPVFAAVINKGAHIPADFRAIQVNILFIHGGVISRQHVNTQIKTGMMFLPGVDKPELPARGRVPIRSRVHDRLVNRLNAHVEKRAEIILYQRERGAVTALGHLLHLLTAFVQLLPEGAGKLHPLAPGKLLQPFQYFLRKPFQAQHLLIILLLGKQDNISGLHPADMVKLVRLGLIRTLPLAPLAGLSGSRGVFLNVLLLASVTVKLLLRKHGGILLAPHFIPRVWPDAFDLCFQLRVHILHQKGDMGEGPGRATLADFTADQIQDARAILLAGLPLPIRFLFRNGQACIQAPALLVNPIRYLVFILGLENASCGLLHERQRIFLASLLLHGKPGRPAFKLFGNPPERGHGLQPLHILAEIEQITGQGHGAGRQRLQAGLFPVGSHGLVIRSPGGLQHGPEQILNLILFIFRGILPGLSSGSDKLAQGAGGVLRRLHTHLLITGISLKSGLSHRQGKRAALRVRRLHRHRILRLDVFPKRAAFLLPGGFFVQDFREILSEKGVILGGGHLHQPQAVFQPPVTLRVHLPAQRLPLRIRPRSHGRRHAADAAQRPVLTETVNLLHHAGHKLANQPVHLLLPVLLQKLGPVLLKQSAPHLLFHPLAGRQGGPVIRVRGGIQLVIGLPFGNLPPGLLHHILQLRPLLRPVELLPMLPSIISGHLFIGIASNALATASPGAIFPLFP